jgi:hypothetical protein
VRERLGKHLKRNENDGGSGGKQYGQHNTALRAVRSSWRAQLRVLTVTETVCGAMATRDVPDGTVKVMWTG